MKLRDYIAKRDSFIETELYLALHNEGVSPEVIDRALQPTIADAAQRWERLVDPRIGAEITKCVLPEPERLVHTGIKHDSPHIKDGKYVPVRDEDGEIVLEPGESIAELWPNGAMTTICRYGDNDHKIVLGKEDV